MSAAAQDKIFACPADTFYVELKKTGAYLYHISTVRSNLWGQPLFDYSSYAFNGGTTMRSFSFSSTPGAQIIQNGGAIYNDSKDMVGFVDGHVSHIKIYWDTNAPNGIHSLALLYNPPAGYDYKWSGD